MRQRTNLKCLKHNDATNPISDKPNNATNTISDIREKVMFPPPRLK